MLNRLALIDASAAMRLRVEQFVREEWPDASVDLFDPADPLPGSDFDSSRYDIIVIGLVEDSVTALDLLYVLGQNSRLPPILFLAPSDHHVKGSEAFLALAKATLPRETLNHFDLRNALASLLATRLGYPLDINTRAVTEHFRARSAETPLTPTSRELPPAGPIKALASLAPNICIIDGAHGTRRLLGSYMHQRWPNAVIEEIDPFSQSMVTDAHGAESGFATGADLVIVGGLGSREQALDTLYRLDGAGSFPPAILLISRDMEEFAGEFAAAGASALFFRDAFSARDLVDAAERLIGRNSREIPLHHPVSAPTLSAAERGTFTLNLKGTRCDVEIEGYRSLARLAGNDLDHVFYAEGLRDRNRVVIKVMSGMPLSDQRLANSFVEMYAFLGAKADRCIVSMIDGGVTDNFPYMVFEYLHAGDLRRRIDGKHHGNRNDNRNGNRNGHRNGALPPEEAVGIVRRLAEALSVMHADCVAHLDLKPENVFFRDDGSVVLIDFNIATRFGAVAGRKIAGVVMGTPNYMSPELAQGLPVDGRSDLYSLGVMFFEMLSGEKPFSAESAATLIYKHIHDEIPLLPKALREFQPVIDRLMAKQPDVRYQTAGELVAALAPWPQATASQNA